MAWNAYYNIHPRSRNERKSRGRRATFLRISRRYVQDELRYDHYPKQADQIYRLALEAHNRTRNPDAPAESGASQSSTTFRRQER